MYLGEYQLVGSEMSYFTRKLEVELRFQQVPWRTRPVCRCGILEHYLN